MKRLLATFCLLFIIISYTYAQVTQREDGIWARNIDGETITLDGMLDETVWSQAESLQVIYGEQGPIPTSAWRPEFQEEAITDPIRATVKFLADGNTLYLGFIIPDSSIGGTVDWARWDAILMSVKDASSPDRPAAAAEFFYTFWLAGGGDTLTPWIGRPPRFIGKFGDFEADGRTPEQIEAWDAVSNFVGVTNDDQPDELWVVEMKIDASALGYDVTSEEGGVIALNFSIWDADNVFGSDPNIVSSARAWWQAPWGNAHGPNFGRVYVRPDVTVNSGTLPVVEPDVIIPNLVNSEEPVIDGVLDEEEWDMAFSIEIAWGDSNLRKTYTNVGPLASGQWQPELVQGQRPPILDPSHAVVKMFVKDNFLFLGADVDDQLIQGTEVYDKVDGIGLILADREEVDLDNVPVFKLLRANFSGDTLQAYDQLPGLIDTTETEVAASLKGSSTVNDNTDIDEGYQIELKLDLTGLHYPEDLGDRLVFGGIDLYDGDSFEDMAQDYGTRTWWFREHAGGPAAAWMVIEDVEVGVNDDIALVPNSLTLYGNYPNPFNPVTKIRYSIPAPGNVNILIYNVIGEELRNINLNNLAAGEHTYNFDASSLASGVYLYKIVFTNAVKNTVSESKLGKMVLMK